MDAAAGTFDAVVSSYLPKYVNPRRFLTNLLPYLEPGAVVAMHDFACPKNAFLRHNWTVWMRVIQHVGIRVFPQWRQAFDGDLEGLIRSSKWSSQFKGVMHDLGFEDLNRVLITGQMAAVVTGRWPG